MYRLITLFALLGCSIVALAADAQPLPRGPSRLGNASQIRFDNAGTGLAGDDVQEVIEELDAAGGGGGHSDGTNCSAGEAARGVDASGNAQDCFEPQPPTGSVAPGDLDTGVDTPGDGECYAYDAGSGDGEWITCGGGGGTDLTNFAQYLAGTTEADLTNAIAACPTGETQFGSCDIHLQADATYTVTSPVAINDRYGVKLFCHGAEIVWGGGAAPTSAVVHIGTDSGTTPTHFAELLNCQIDPGAGTRGNTTDDAGIGVLFEAGTTTNQFSRLADVRIIGDSSDSSTYLAGSVGIQIEDDAVTSGGDQIDKLTLDGVNIRGFDTGIEVNSGNALNINLRQSTVFGGNIAVDVNNGGFTYDTIVAGCVEDACAVFEQDGNRQGPSGTGLHIESAPDDMVVLRVGGGYEQNPTLDSYRSISMRSTHLRYTGCTPPACNVYLVDGTYGGNITITGHASGTDETNQPIAVQLSGSTAGGESPALDISGFRLNAHPFSKLTSNGATIVEAPWRPRDLDGDNGYDFIRIEGDIDGDGVVSVDDIQFGIGLLTDSDSQRTVELAANTYTAETTGAKSAGVVLPAYTSLMCDAGAVLQGYDIPTAVAWGGAHLIVTDDATYAVDRISTGDSAINEQIFIDGCGLEFDFTCLDLYDTGGPPQTSGSPDGACDVDGVSTVENGSPFDGSSLPNNLRAIQLKNASNFGITNNVVKSTQHAGIYTRSSNDGTISFNRLIDVGSHNDTTDSSNFPGIYIFVDDRLPSARITVANNTVNGAGSGGLHSRAQARCVGGVDDGVVCAFSGDYDCTDLYDTGGPPQTTGSPDSLCDIDGATAVGIGAAGVCDEDPGVEVGICEVLFVENITWTGNVVQNAQYGGSFSSLVNSAVVGNTFTDISDDAIFFASVPTNASYYTSTTAGDDSSYNVVVSGNTVRNAGLRGLNIDNGHEDILVVGNTFIDIATAYDYGILFGVPYRNLTFKDNLIDGVGDGGFDAALGIIGFTSPGDNSGLVIDGNVARNIGTSNDQYFLYNLSTTLTDVTFTNNTVSRADSSTLSCFHFQQLPIATTRILFHGNDCGNNHSADLIRRHKDVKSALTGGSFLQVSGNPTSFDCVDLYNDCTDCTQTTGSPDGLCDDDGVSVVCGPGAVWIDTTGTGSAFYYCRATGSGGAWVNP